MCDLILYEIVYIDEVEILSSLNHKYFIDSEMKFELWAKGRIVVS